MHVDIVFLRLDKIKNRLGKLPWSEKRENLYDRIVHLREDILSCEHMSSKEFKTASKAINKQYKSLYKDVENLIEFEMEEKEISQNIE